MNSAQERHFTSLHYRPESNDFPLLFSRQSPTALRTHLYRLVAVHCVCGLPCICTYAVCGCNAYGCNGCGCKCLMLGKRATPRACGRDAFYKISQAVSFGPKQSFYKNGSRSSRQGMTGSTLHGAPFLAPLRHLLTNGFIGMKLHS